MNSESDRKFYHHFNLPARFELVELFQETVLFIRQRNNSVFCQENLFLLKIFHLIIAFIFILVNHEMTK